MSPSTVTLSPDLALLLAPVRLAGPASARADDYVGRAEGAILDDSGHLVAFLVRLSSKLVWGSPRTLVPISAVTVTDDSVLILAWTQEKLLEQRRLDEDLQPQAATANDPVVISSTGPAPGEGKVDVNETVKEGVEGSAIGAVVGGILGGIAGGPVLGFALAAFFGVGGGLAGFIAGGGQETHIDPEETAPEPRTGIPALARLEERLRDPMLAVDGLVHTTRFSPLDANDGSLAQKPSPAHVP